MNSKALVLSIISLVAGAAIVITASNAQRKSPQQQISDLEEKEKRAGLMLKEHVKLAKLRGQQKLFIPKSYNASFYPSVRNVDVAAAVYTIVIAQPTAMTSRLNDQGQIVTSYKFRTIEVLSEPASQKFPFTFSGSFPPELQPFGEGEFLLTTSGGTLEVDGIEVTTKYDDFELFSLNGKYLLFLDFDTTKKMGGMDMGPLSALGVKEDGSMATLDNQESHEIKQVINSRFGNSIERLKNHLQNRKN